MSGTDRMRFCRQCGKNVYNLAALTREEAEAFVRQREWNSCIRLHRRADGTMLAGDCPVGLRRIRRAARRSWALIGGGLASILGLFVGGITYSSAERKGLRELEPFKSILDVVEPPRTPAPVALPVEDDPRMAILFTERRQGSISIGASLFKRGRVLHPPSPVVNERQSVEKIRVASQD